MKLVAITVKNFRSITKAHKLQLGTSTVLIGRNNEGKSNILRALALGLNLLQRGQRVVFRAGQNQRAVFISPHYDRFGGFKWESDYPIVLQQTDPQGASEITLEFELDNADLAAFQKSIGSTLNGNLPIRISFGREGESVSIAKQGPGAQGLT